MELFFLSSFSFAFQVRHHLNVNIFHKFSHLHIWSNITRCCGKICNKKRIKWYGDERRRFVFHLAKEKKNIFIFFITLNIFIKCASFGMYWWKQDIRPTVVVVVIKMKSFDGDLLFSARIVFIVLLFVPMYHGYTFNQTKPNQIKYPKRSNDLETV